MHRSSQFLLSTGRFARPVRGTRGRGTRGRRTRGRGTRAIVRNLLCAGALIIVQIGSVAAQVAGNAGSDCAVVTRLPEVNAAGEFVRPSPTDAECELAGSLEAKFLATPPGDFRQVRDMTRLSEPVRNYVAGLGGTGTVRGPVSVQIGRVPQTGRQAVVVWLGSELVVVAYRSSDLAGSSTDVLLADLATLTACNYLRWRGGELPADLRIAEIQGALEASLLGERETPACHLRQIPLD